MSSADGHSIRVPSWLHLRLLEAQIDEYRRTGKRPALIDLVVSAWQRLEALDPAAAYAPVLEDETPPKVANELDMSKDEYELAKQWIDSGIANVSELDKQRVAEYERAHLPK